MTKYTPLKHNYTVAVEQLKQITGDLLNKDYSHPEDIAKGNYNNRSVNMSCF